MIRGGSEYLLFASLFAKKYGYESLHRRAMEELYISSDSSHLLLLEEECFDPYRDEAYQVVTHHI